MRVPMARMRVTPVTPLRPVYVVEERGAVATRFGRSPPTPCNRSPDGIDVVMITGDAKDVADAVARTLDIDAAYAGVLPVANHCANPTNR
jgi:hypothetical protein